MVARDPLHPPPEPFPRPKGPGVSAAMSDSLTDALNNQAEAIREQTELLRQIAGALFQIAGEQESEEESGPDTYLDGSPR